MTPWLVLPVKSLADGKSRLAPHLAPDARRALNTRLLERSLALATGFAGARRTLVVSHCEEVLARASAAGAYALREPHPGLNEGLSHACELLGRREGERLIVLACDLPLASAEDLAALAVQDGVVLATDRGVPVSLRYEQPTTAHRRSGPPGPALPGGTAAGSGF